MAELFRTKDDKHIPVEANLLTADNALAVSIWCNGGLVTEHDALQHDVTFQAINVRTPHGVKRAQEGDWIVLLPTGDFYPVKAEAFDDTFEAVVNA